MAATFEATAMAIYLSLNVEVVDDQRGADFLAIPLLSLAWVLAAGWWCQSQTIKFHPGIFDSQPEKSRHEVLHGGDLKAVVPDGCGQVGVYNTVKLGLDHGMRRKVLSDERDPMVRGSWFDGHVDGMPRMKAYSRARNLISDCSLSVVHAIQLSLQDPMA